MVDLIADLGKDLSDVALDGTGVIGIFLEPHIHEDVFFEISFEGEGVDFGGIFVEIFVDNQSTEHGCCLFNVLFGFDEYDFHGGLVDYILTDRFVHPEGPRKRLPLVVERRAVRVQQFVHIVKNAS